MREVADRSYFHSLERNAILANLDKIAKALCGYCSRGFSPHKQQALSQGTPPGQAKASSGYHRRRETSRHQSVTNHFGDSKPSFDGVRGPFANGIRAGVFR